MPSIGQRLISRDLKEFPIKIVWIYSKQKKVIVSDSRILVNGQYLIKKYKGSIYELAI